MNTLSQVQLRNQRGFTLIELIAVMVVIGIIGGLTTQFVVGSVNSYREGQARQKVIAKGRTTFEQMTRYIRSAAPNSLRVSSTGLCLELLPTVGGAFYDGQVADLANNAPSTNRLTTSPFSLGLGEAQHAIIGGLSAAEIYSVSPSARADIGSQDGTSIDLSTPHRFIRNSSTQRVFMTDDPVRFCIRAGALVQYLGYGLETSMADTDPGGATALMANDVAADGTAFVLSNGTEDRNSTLDMNLVFSNENISVPLSQTVFVRNVP